MGEVAHRCGPPVRPATAWLRAMRRRMVRWPAWVAVIAVDGPGAPMASVIHRRRTGDAWPGALQARRPTRAGSGPQGQQGQGQQGQQGQQTAQRAMPSQRCGMADCIGTASAAACARTLAEASPGLPALHRIRRRSIVLGARERRRADCRSIAGIACATPDPAPQRRPRRAGAAPRRPGARPAARPGRCRPRPAPPAARSTGRCAPRTRCAGWPRRRRN